MNSIQKHKRTRHKQISEIERLTTRNEILCGWTVEAQHFSSDFDISYVEASHWSRKFNGGGSGACPFDEKQFIFRQQVLTNFPVFFCIKKIRTFLRWVGRWRWRLCDPLFDAFGPGSKSRHQVMDPGRHEFRLLHGGPVPFSFIGN